jgi:hypothetical protein
MHIYTFSMRSPKNIENRAKPKIELHPHIQVVQLFHILQELIFGPPIVVLQALPVLHDLDVGQYVRRMGCVNMSYQQRSRTNQCYSRLWNVIGYSAKTLRKSSYTGEIASAPYPVYQVGRSGH